jgi:4'-phosphopantetheinyl transferase EntD
VIEALLPHGVVAEEATGPLPGEALFPEEEELVARAVGKRREEFTTGRECARRALARLGVAPGPIGSGPKREPLWPAGIAGSITHCRGYRAAAVARVADVAALGIDAEPNEPLPDGVLKYVAAGDETALLDRLAAEDPGVRWDRLMFSAKESVYKAWFPLARRWLGFHDAALAIDRERGTFTARLLVPGPAVAGRPVESFHGRWAVEGGLVLTAVAVEP